MKFRPEKRSTIIHSARGLKAIDPQNGPGGRSGRTTSASTANCIAARSSCSLTRRTSQWSRVFSLSTSTTTDAAPAESAR